MSEKYIALSDLMKFPIRIDHYDKEHGNENFVYGIETVLEYAEYLPVIEIVRCKDCEYGELDENGNTWCTFYSERIREMPNGYCWHGKRRNNDER